MACPRLRPTPLTPTCYCSSRAQRSLLRRSSEVPRSFTGHNGDSFLLSRYACAHTISRKGQIKLELRGMLTQIEGTDATARMPAGRRVRLKELTRRPAGIRAARRMA